MDRVRKTYFDPLVTSKALIKKALEELPVGSAHPFSPEKILLCHTEEGIQEIDISSYPEDYFFNAVDLGEMGEVLLRRMANFKSHLEVFDDFQIQQAPASTFKIPVVDHQITILAVSELTPTYYDFCFGDVDNNTCCWLARETFAGIRHSGDIVVGRDLLDYIKVDANKLTEKEICVFISGYQETHITRFLGTYPALMVADHVDKILYIIPVPLDAATIGTSTICCPLVVKRDNDSLICSILPTASTDQNMMCCANRMETTAFKEAISRADFNISTQAPAPVIPREVAKDETATEDDLKKKQESLQKIMANESAVITTSSVTVPSLLNVDNSQIVRFGTSLDFKSPDRDLDPSSSSVILPCIFGTPMQGPLMLATGRVSSNAPFANDTAIREYFQQLKEIVFIVDDRMTDNARNLATSYRINALFVIQLPPPAEAPKDSDAVLSLLNAANINAVTALAGPQSLILVQIGDKYYFYRGIANREHLNTSSVVFGTDITSTIQTTGLRSLVDPRAKRIIDLEETNAILMPTTGQLVKHTELKEMFENLPIDKINGLEEDISAIVPQLQVLLNQKDLSELSKTLVSAISGKVSSVTAPLRKEYIHYLTKELKRGDPESEKKKSVMLGELRKTTKDLQKQLEPAISSLANMMSSQTTSKRTHDLQKLVRQAAINTNVETAKTMNFETMAGFLEEYAGEMGVMLVNIQTEPFRSLLGNLKNAAIDATPACELDSRMIHLPGLDAGLIMEQSQNEHYGPLKSTSGPDHPTLGLPYLSPGQGHGGSMLAWVCWDEFVNLESPYSVRWMEKCNEGHIAVLRIIMRDTLSQAITSREHNMQSGSLETGHLMSAMLMAAMKKLAAMRTTIPKVIGKAEDTVTLLMRGLFGNLLTIAGSGVQPLSMVWQLFGLNPAYDIPKTEVDWVWYETVVALYPYTGWKRERFYENLEKLLDKAIVRVVTKNEDAAQMKSSQADDLIKFCKLRNIQLDHSRTIITAFMRMLTMEGADVKAIAGRLLEHIPNRLDKQSQSYTKMIKYLQHLATGGERRIPDDVVAAGVYHKRSAAFSDLKTKIREASVASDWPKVKELCQQLLKEHEDVAKLWHIPVDSFHIQNIKLYQSLRQADFTTEDQTEKVKNFALTRQVLGDAETRRTPWQVGKPGQYSDEIEPLNEGFLHELLTGEEAGAIEAGQDTITGGTSDAVVSVVKEKDPFEEYESSLSPSFIQDLQKDLTAAQVCQIMKVPETAMRVFAHALSPDFEFSQLNTTFKLVILGLLRNRSNRLESEPVKKLFEITRKEPRMLEQGGAGGSPMQTD